MHITKQIVISLNIEDPILDGTSSKILAKIREKYENKCFDGCLIRTVNRIVRKSELIINREGSPDFATVSAVVEITGIIYVAGEIICGAVVKKNDSSGMLCETPTAVITLHPDPRYSAINSNDKLRIMVRVVEARYTIGEPRVTVGARVFDFSPDPIGWRVPAGASVDVALLEPILAEIKDLQGRLARFPAEHRNKMSYLLFPYRLPPAAREKDLRDPFAIGGAIFDLMNMIRNDKFYFSSIDAIKKSDGDDIVYWRTPMLNPVLPLVRATNDELEATYTLQPEAAAVAIFRHYCDSLRVLVENLEIYNEAELKRHNLLWQILEAIKLEHVSAPAPSAAKKNKK